MKPLHMVATGWAEEARALAGPTLLSLGGFGQNDVPSMGFLAWRRADATGRCLDAAPRDRRGARRAGAARGRAGPAARARARSSTRSAAAFPPVDERPPARSRRRRAHGGVRAPGVRRAGGGGGGRREAVVVASLMTRAASERAPWRRFRPTMRLLCAWQTERASARDPPTPRPDPQPATAAPAPTPSAGARRSPRRSPPPSAPRCPGAGARTPPRSRRGR